MNEIIDRSYSIIKPYIEKAKAQSYIIKNQIYDSLNDHQKALFAFHAYYQHAKSDFTSFYFYSKEFIDIGFWKEIKNGIRYFNNDDIMEYFERIEKAINDDNDIEGLKILYEEFWMKCQRHLLLINEVITCVKRNRKQ
jgi:hypothetical protein